MTPGSWDEGWAGVMAPAPEVCCIELILGSLLCSHTWQTLGKLCPLILLVISCLPRRGLDFQPYKQEIRDLPSCFLGCQCEQAPWVWAFLPGFFCYPEGILIHHVRAGVHRPLGKACITQLPLLPDTSHICPLKYLTSIGGWSPENENTADCQAVCHLC